MDPLWTPYGPPMDPPTDPYGPPMNTPPIFVLSTCFVNLFCQLVLSTCFVNLFFYPVLPHYAQPDHEELAVAASRPGLCGALYGPLCGKKQREASRVHANQRRDRQCRSGHCSLTVSPVAPFLKFMFSCFLFLFSYPLLRKDQPELEPAEKERGRQ